VIGAPGLVVGSRNVGGVFNVDVPVEVDDRIDTVTVADLFLSQDNDGAQFGDNFLLADINADSIDDLIVALPLYGDIIPADFFHNLFYTKKYYGKI